MTGSHLARSAAKRLCLPPLSVLVAVSLIPHQGIPATPICPTGQTIKIVNSTATCANCTACGPGYEPTTSCGPALGKDTACSPCPNGTFSDITSVSARCQRCTSPQCSGNSFIKTHLRKCTLYEDTSCDECGEGNYRSKDTHACEPCMRCEPYEEEVQLCTLYTNRKCALNSQLTLQQDPQSKSATYKPTMSSTLSSTDATTAVIMPSSLTSPITVNEKSSSGTPTIITKKSTLTPPYKNTQGISAEPRTTSDSPNPASHDSDTSTTVIAASISAGLVVVVIVIIMAICLHKRDPSIITSNEASQEARESEQPHDDRSQGAQEVQGQAHETSAIKETGGAPQD